MSSAIAKLATVAELRDVDRRAVKNDVESIGAKLSTVTGGAGLLGDCLVGANIALRDGKFRRA